MNFYRGYVVRITRAEGNFKYEVVWGVQRGILFDVYKCEMRSADKQKAIDYAAKLNNNPNVIVVGHNGEFLGRDKMDYEYVGCSIKPHPNF